MGACLVPIAYSPGFPKNCFGPLFPETDVFGRRSYIAHVAKRVSDILVAAFIDTIASEF